MTASRIFAINDVMPFHSLSFIYLFLPVTAILFFAIRKVSITGAQILLISASIGFYAYGDTAGLPVLISSILINFLLGKRLIPPVDPAAAKNKSLLIAGIALNVLCLSFFKYAHAFITPQDELFFPLALSFYTFSQISYLVELYQGKIVQPTFLDYLVYILFFPKLVAGPIARPSEFLPQISSPAFGKFEFERVGRGLTFFFVGLFKKAFIADQIAPYANKLFELADGNKAISFYHAWTGTMTYGMQLYFDFSGYSDMAIGIALILGVILPINFDAPYKSASITEFWRKWHMTLSYFFRDYVYIPLGGSRAGSERKYVNLIVVMVLCGMWHGSAITFVLWGLMHGCYLIIHNVWLNLRKSNTSPDRHPSVAGIVIARLLTFAAVTVAWVPFRSTSLKASGYLFSNLFNIPSSLPTKPEIALFSLILLPALLLVFFLPTTQSILEHPHDAHPETATQPNGNTTPWYRWKLNLPSGIIAGCIAAAGLLMMSDATIFIYKGF